MLLCLHAIERNNSFSSMGIAFVLHLHTCQAVIDIKNYQFLSVINNVARLLLFRYIKFTLFNDSIGMSNSWIGTIFFGVICLRLFLRSNPASDNDGRKMPNHIYLHWRVLHKFRSSNF